MKFLILFALIVLLQISHSQEYAFVPVLLVKIQAQTEQTDPNQQTRGSEEISEYYNVKDVRFTLIIMAIAVVSLFLYLARDTILRRKTGYEEKDLESKKNRDYEKYHSTWNEEETDFNYSSKRNKDADEFRKLVRESKLPDYYTMLGVSNDAGQKEIKTRFRQLVKELHPDKTKDERTAERFTEISEAYRILSDVEKRKIYDAYFKASSD